MKLTSRNGLFLTFFSLVMFFGGTGYVSADFNPLDINGNSILDKDESQIFVDSNISLPAGEYFFQNLTITNGSTLTLLGDPGSLNSFKGVKINATNLTVESGSSISANGRGYFIGPGTPPTNLYFAGASYGGVGDSNIATSTYGSATYPRDLGSGSGDSGGGAIEFVISNTLSNNGSISASGRSSGSGGSILINTNILAGSGVFQANGGGIFITGYFASLGGGGRVAVYYKSFSFTGEVVARGGCGSYDGFSLTCSDSGTVGFFDILNNNFWTNTSWRFLKNDGPFHFNHIVLKNSAKVKAEDGATITANDLVLDNVSVLDIADNELINIPIINISNGSSATLSGSGALNAETINLTENSGIVASPQKILYLKVKNLTVESGSFINADEKGYSNGVGPGAPVGDALYFAGASYGGAGYLNIPSSTYGSSTEPVDFGSSGNGYHPHGGGAIRLLVTGTLSNDGTISADGGSTSSGGSIYVTANNLIGAGAFHANGGQNYCPNVCFGSGGGGRVAIYYQNSTFSGGAESLGGLFCYYGCPRLGENGTVVMEQYTPTPVCTTDCFSNVLFIPGIMGSRLYQSGEELWVSSSDSKQADLALDIQGKSINDIYTKDDTQNNGELDETGIVDDVYSFNIYQSFITDLKNWKNDGTIKDYAFIPYDWRLSLNDIITNGATTTGNKLSYTQTQDFSESFILKKLEELQKSSKSKKVTIIAHSNGGLVVKALIQKLKDTNNPLYDKIDKIIFIAVPQVGTPDAMAELLHGESLSYGTIMYDQRSRQLSENMPSIYNLLPSSGYFTTIDPAFAVDKVFSFENKPFFSPQTSQYGLFVSNPTELKNYVLGTDGRSKPAYNDTIQPNIGNSFLYSQAETVHQYLDSWQPSQTTKVIQVAGWGEETLAGLDYKTYAGFSPHTDYLSYTPRMVVDGDGTVVVPSALWMSTSTPNVERWWVDLSKYNRLFSLHISRKHRDILEISNLSDFIKSEIISSTFIDPNNILVNNAPNSSSDAPHLHYTLHSPLTLGVTDSQNRYTGQDPTTRQIREEIPGVTYRQIGDVQFLSIPEGIVHILKLKGYQDGNFSLDIDKQEGNTITQSTSFQGIPSSASTVVTMNIGSSLDVASSTLNIDQNGDQTVDKILKAAPGGITVYDVTPPEISISFSTSTREVMFSGIDTSPVTLTHSIASTIAVDYQGNKSVLNYTRYKEKPTRLKLSFNTIIRNELSTTFPNTNVQYNWAEKNGVLTDLDTNVTIKGVEMFVFNYKKVTNTTTIREKLKNGTNTSIIRQGFVVVKVETGGNEIKINY